MTRLPLLEGLLIIYRIKGISIKVYNSMNI